MMDTFGEAFKQIIDEFTDAERHPLVAESADWDKIVPALKELGVVTAKVGLIEDTARCWRYLLETVYVMGYRRGKAAKPPEFVVAEDGS
jgi:hypothetical protein